MTGDVVLRVDDLTKHYAVESSGALLVGIRKTVKANEKITFRAHEAETIAIVGESGCGKSTFAKVLMGLEDATSGKIELDDLDLANLPVQRRDRQHHLAPADDLPKPIRHAEPKSYRWERRSGG